MNCKKYFILFGLLLIVLLSIFFYKKQIPVSRDGHKVAFIVPAHHPAMDDIFNGFAQDLKKSIQNVEVIHYNAQGNQLMLQSYINEIINNNFDCVVTVGAFASQLMHEMIIINKKKLPHVFVAVDDPLGKGLVESLDRPGKGITGVISEVDFESQIDSLLDICPSIKTLLLPYDPNHPSNIPDIAVLREILLKRSINLVITPIVRTNDIATIIPLMVDGIDAMMILKDHTLVMGLSLLYQICVKKNIPLYASDLNSADSAAAFAFGIYELDYGRYAVKSVYKILVEKLDPGAIPVLCIKNNYFKINRTIAQEQGVRLSSEELAIMGYRERIIVI